MHLRHYSPAFNVLTDAVFVQVVSMVPISLMSARYWPRHVPHSTTNNAPFGSIGCSKKSTPEVSNNIINMRNNNTVYPPHRCQTTVVQCGSELDVLRARSRLWKSLAIRRKSCDVGIHYLGQVVLRSESTRCS